MDSQGFSLILTIVNRGFADVVMDAAREAGARGGTVMHARGTGTAETLRIFGITIEPEKDLILILTKNSVRQAIMKSINHAAGLSTKGSGISISMPAEDVIGATFGDEDE